MKIEDVFRKGLEVHQKTVQNLIDENLNDFTKMVEAVENSLKNDGKLIIFGNGGSAADAQHIAAELVGRFKMERKGLPAIALSVNTSILTAIGNDYSFDEIFVRQIEAIGKKGDVAIGISTSGNAENVIRAINKAKEIGIATIGLTGKDGGKLKDIVNIPIIIKTEDTARIQECHIFLGHILCEIIENLMNE